MTITKRAAIVLQQIDADLALAEKATPGPWEYTTDNKWDAQGRRILRINGKPQIFSGFDADLTFIAASRTGWPTSLRCLRTAIEGQLERIKFTGKTPADIVVLTTLCDQWEAGRK